MQLHQRLCQQINWRLPQKALISMNILKYYFDMDFFLSPSSDPGTATRSQKNNIFNPLIFLPEEKQLFGDANFSGWGGGGGEIINMWNLKDIICLFYSKL